jgi:urease accessory protein UreF
MSATGHIDQLNRIIDLKFTEFKQQFVDELVKTHKKIEEHKEEQQQMGEKLQQVKEELEPDPMSTIIKVS